MIVLEGQQALSPFRRERLEARLQSVCPTLVVSGAWHVYFVEAEAGQVPDDAVIRRILEVDPGPAPGRSGGAVSRYVSPRLGTISPWASKSTELLRGAGLPVRRVERGLRLDLGNWPADPALQAAVS